RERELTAGAGSCQVKNRRERPSRPLGRLSIQDIQRNVWEQALPAHRAPNVDRGNGEPAALWWRGDVHDRGLGRQRWRCTLEFEIVNHEECSALHMQLSTRDSWRGDGYIERGRERARLNEPGTILSN